MGFALSNMQLTSPAFRHGGAIPAKYTGEGDDTSPALSWTGIPEGTQSLAVLCHDPDAPLVTSRGTYGFVHWVLYNLPPSIDSLPEGVEGYTVGPNDFGNPGYGGPMPPDGHGTHQYYFWVLALSAAPELEEGLSMWEFLARTEPQIIGMNRLVGTYERA
ncbi:YbhB/YbcL family Raf kinase inhibitor-like protein [Aquisalimonas sp.]|uniref:YbhB/YbcL family Raf kinase inhibitor-like protein n=1 Tax=Aquisalimonas sp. TaxID=1872621 RepID=UPI0025B9E359|nr:YbhB/YbcL family Raf kinase inhibitor-like protein [Aquisalimonas sp.]